MTESTDRSDLTAQLLATAAAQPSAPVLMAPGRAPLAWSTLGAMIRRLGAKLEGWGIRRGDIIVWSTEGRAETAAALLALPVGAAVCALGVRTALDDCLELLARIRPKAVVVDAGALASPLEIAADRLGIARMSMIPHRGGEVGTFDLRLTRSAPSLEAARRVPDTWALLTPTSGSTGRAKLVPRTHAQIVAVARSMSRLLTIGPEDRSAHTTPLHHASGTGTTLLTPVLAGAAVICLPEAGIDELLEEVRTGHVTIVTSTYTIFRELLQRCASAPVAGHHRLRMLRASSGALEAEEIDRLEGLFDVPVLISLSSTESGVITHQLPPPARRVRGSVGPPLDCDIRIADPLGQPVAPGETGELLVRGPQVFEGYLDDPDLNASAFVDGWFRLGDLARFDDDGELHLAGRIKDFINRGGTKIAPLAIDAALRAIPGVDDAAAFGVPHPRLGEEVVAAVVRSKGAAINEDEILEQLRPRLGAARSPRRIWFVDSLPRTDAGKLRRSALPAWVGYEDSPSTDEELPLADPARSPTETALAALWTAVLGNDRVLRDEDFLAQDREAALGIKLLDQVRMVFAVDLPIATLDENACTIAGMAKRIERARSAGGSN